MGQPAPKKDRSPRRPEKGWEHVADWYRDWVGKEGAEHHQRVTIPAVLDLLEVQPGERILDIGAGTGILAPAVKAAGGNYVGVDASPSLLRFARKHHGNAGRFVVADARKLDQSKELAGASFDAAVFLLSLQDMNPLSPIFHSVSRMLSPEGRVAILMTHPCFRVPRQSGWVWDEGRQLQSRRVDRYLTPLVVPLETINGPAHAPTARFHRPLADYINGLAEVGLMTERMVEIPWEKARTSGQRNRAEHTASQEIPMFLGLRARRPI